MELPTPSKLAEQHTRAGHPCRPFCDNGGESSLSVARETDDICGYRGDSGAPLVHGARVPPLHCECCSDARQPSVSVADVSERTGGRNLFCVSLMCPYAASLCTFWPRRAGCAVGSMDKRADPCSLSCFLPRETTDLASRVVL